MGIQFLMQQIHDAAMESQVSLDFYIQSHDVKYLERFIFWSEACMKWVAWLNQEQDDREGLK